MSQKLSPIYVAYKSAIALPFYLDTESGIQYVCFKKKAQESEVVRSNPNSYLLSISLLTT